MIKSLVRSEGYYVTSVIQRLGNFMMILHFLKMQYLTWRKMSRFEEVIEELKEIHRKKSSDYGDTEFANIRSSQDFGVRSWIGAMVRLNDKVKRIQQYITKGNLNYESVRDSLIDISVYAIIATVLFDEEESNKEQDKVIRQVVTEITKAISKENLQLKEDVHQSIIRETDPEGFFRGNLT